jgi:hypothetical protein
MQKKRKNHLFNKLYTESLISTCREIKFDPYPILYTKTNSKWSMHLNIILETENLLIENLEEKFLALSLGDWFLDMTPKV